MSLTLQETKTTSKKGDSFRQDQITVQSSGSEKRKDLLVFMLTKQILGKQDGVKGREREQKAKDLFSQVQGDFLAVP